MMAKIKKKNEKIMLVRMKTNYAGPRGTCSEGKIIKLPKREAEALIRGKYAVDMTHIETAAVVTGNQEVMPDAAAKKTATPENDGDM